MAGWKIYPITYKGADKRRWIKEQLVLRHRDEKPVSTFLDLRDLYQSKRDEKQDLEQCKIKPQYNRIIELENIEY